MAGLLHMYSFLKSAIFSKQRRTICTYCTPYDKESMFSRFNVLFLGFSYGVHFVQVLFTPYAIFRFRRSPSESPLHFADRRNESVIVGYYTSAEVPFPRRGQPGTPFVKPSVRRIHIAHRRCEQGFQGARHPWHTTLIQSLVCYTLIEVYRTPNMQKAPCQHLCGADMGLDASSD